MEKGNHGGLGVVNNSESALAALPPVSVTLPELLSPHLPDPTCSTE